MKSIAVLNVYWKSEAQIPSGRALEFEAAVRFYKQRGRILGLRFAQEVRTSIGKITHHPDRYRTLEDDVRRCFVQVFPYSILYTIENDHILIIAVMHGKRQPGYWRNRLTKSPG
jgi:toxin ParE1/3/4